MSRQLATSRLLPRVSVLVGPDQDQLRLLRGGPGRGQPSLHIYTYLHISTHIYTYPHIISTLGDAVRLAHAQVLLQEV